MLRQLVVSARVEINRVYIIGHPVVDDDGGVTVTVSVTMSGLHKAVTGQN